MFDSILKPQIANKFRLKTYGTTKGAELELLRENLVSVEISKNLNHDFSTIKLIFEEPGTYTNVFNNLFDRRSPTIVELDLFGFDDHTVKFISIEGIKSAYVENKLTYSESSISKFVVTIEAIDVRQFNTEESTKLFRK